MIKRFQNMRCLDGVRNLDILLTEKEKIIIYGAGKYGKILADYICRKGYRDKLRGMVVTQAPEAQEDYQGILIQSIDTFCGYNENANEYTFLIAASMRYQIDIVTEMEKRGIKIVYCMTWYLMARLENMSKSGKGKHIQKLDFLVAGFCKCGTTTLQRVLEREQQVYLPAQKETFYYQFKGNLECPLKIWEDIFFSEQIANRLVGSVDPTFFGHAEDVYHEFGSNVKIVLVMRNPIDAIYSLAKMQIRCGDDFFERYYDKYQGYSSEMPLKYAEYRMNMPYFEFFYEEWVAEYQKYFGKENVLILIFEELIHNPREEMNRLYRFIGLDSAYNEDALPKANEGNYVLKDKRGYEIAATRYAYQHYRQHHPDTIYCDEDYRRLMELETAYQYAEKIYDEKLGEKDRIFLEEKFKNHVRQLEEIIGRSLKKVWF